MDGRPHSNVRPVSGPGRIPLTREERRQDGFSRVADLVCSHRRRTGGSGCRDWRRLIATRRYRVHYLHATNLPARAVPAYVGTAPSPTPGYPPELMVREAEEAGSALFQQLGIDVESSTVKIVHGDPVEELRRRADELEPDFLVLGNRRHGPLTRLILGSVTQAMATHGRWPLLVVSEADDHAAQGPVICGVAASGEEALRTVDVATRFARHLGRPLVLAHVRDDDSATAIHAGFPAAPGGVVSLASPPSPNSDPATTLSDIVGTLGGEDMEYVLLDGCPPRRPSPTWRRRSMPKRLSWAVGKSAGCAA